MFARIRKAVVAAVAVAASTFIATLVGVELTVAQEAAIQEVALAAVAVLFGGVGGFATWLVPNGGRLIDWVRSRR